MNSELDIGNATSVFGPTHITFWKRSVHIYIYIYIYICVWMFIYICVCVRGHTDLFTYHSDNLDHDCKTGRGLTCTSANYANCQHPLYCNYLQRPLAGEFWIKTQTYSTLATVQATQRSWRHRFTLVPVAELMRYPTVTTGIEVTDDIQTLICKRYLLLVITVTTSSPGGHPHEWDVTSEACFNCHFSTESHRQDLCGYGHRIREPRECAGWRDSVRMARGSRYNISHFQHPHDTGVRDPDREPAGWCMDVEPTFHYVYQVHCVCVCYWKH